MLKLISGSGGRNKMIFAAICIVVGICLFAFYDNLQNQRVSLFGVEVLHRSMDALGKYGFCGIYIVGGLVVGLKGFLESKAEKQSSQQ